MEASFNESSPIFRQISQETEDLNKYLNKIKDDIMKLDETKLKESDNSKKLEIEKKTDDLKKHYRDYYQLKKYQIDKLRESAQDPIILEIKTVIRLLCINEGYSLILDINTPSILYYTVESDVTDKIIEMINEKRKN